MESRDAGMKDMANGIEVECPMANELGKAQLF